MIPDSCSTAIVSKCTVKYPTTNMVPMVHFQTEYLHGLVNSA